MRPRMEPTRAPFRVWEGGQRTRAARATLYALSSLPPHKLRRFLVALTRWELVDPVPRRAATGPSPITSDRGMVSLTSTASTEPASQQVVLAGARTPSLARSRHRVTPRRTHSRAPGIAEACLPSLRSRENGNVGPVRRRGARLFLGFSSTNLNVWTVILSVSVNIRHVTKTGRSCQLFQASECQRAYINGGERGALLSRRHKDHHTMVMFVVTSILFVGSCAGVSTSVKHPVILQFPQGGGARKGKGSRTLQKILYRERSLEKGALDPTGDEARVPLFVGTAMPCRLAD